MFYSSGNDINNAIQFIIYIMYIIGLRKLFVKGNVKKWIAYIPIVNDYYFAKCGDCEDEASALIMSEFFYNSFSITLAIMASYGKAESLAGYMIDVLMIVIYIVIIIYRIRIYAGICEVYNRKKAWIILWVIAKGVVALIWGYSDKFETTHKVESTEKEANKDADKGIEKSAMLKEGLSINIRKRTARKGFVVKTLLKDINLSIEPGKMVLLLGGSGAGKTTFFNAITGYEQADATVTLNGMDVYKHFNKMKYEIGFVPQQDLIRLNDSVYRTLMDSAMLRLPTSVSRAARHKRVNEVMELFGLTAVKDNIVLKQSGGQKKRISIATEYISDPALFILDEPDSGLDGILAKELMQRLHDISREGKIVIVITHTPDRVIDLFDQVIVLAKDEKQAGRLVYFGDIDKAKEFFEKDTMEDIVKSINRPDEGGEGRADELLNKYEEARKNA